jgi:triosephosphate isomerase
MPAKSTARRQFIAGNWKMNMTLRSAAELAAGLVKRLADVTDVEVAVCPAFVHLAEVSLALKNSRIALGAQDCYFEEDGAFTGEISMAMLLDAGCRYVIIGHSERRHVIGETDALVNKKVLKALAAGLRPILCVGETLDERKKSVTEKIVTRHVNEGLKDVPAAKATEVVIAYEPVWAIGTGVNATPEQANEVHVLIRGLLKERFGAESAQAIRIQYGGSVKAENAASLLTMPEIDGALVGGASLKADSFEKIVRYKS